jgi:hypothetical protein
MTRFRLFLALGAAALSLTTARAHAANEVESNFHATICVPANGGASTVYNSFGINNVSTTAPLVVECPLPTTLALSGSNLHIETVYVTFFDRGATRTTCSVKTVDFLATVLNTSTQSSTGSGNGAQILEIDVPSFFGNLETNFWQLECTIPAVNGGNYSALTAIQVIAAP